MEMISVIIPNYNADPFLGRCLASVRRQSNRNWECIVVDDGSTDGSKDTLFKITAGDPKFTLVSFTDNRGLSAARNAGMDWARGEYLFFLDSDDWIPNDALDCLLGEVMVHPDVGRVTGNYIENWPGKVFGHTIEPPGLHLPDGKHFFSGPACDPGHSTGCLYIRKNMPADLRFPKVKLFEDMIFNMGLLFSGAYTFVATKYVYHYMRQEGSLLSKGLTPEEADQERTALKAMADRYNPKKEVYDRCATFLENAMRYRIQK